LSTALVESYRNEVGKPRQRILANLRGAETLESALGRLAAEREQLRKERKQLEPDIEPAERFYEIVTLNTLNGHRYSDDERKEIDGLMKARKRLLKRVAEIDAELGRIQREGIAIKKHCTATADAIRAEAAAHAKKLHQDECYKLGLELALGKRPA
jgi:hypothetical protein